MFGARIGFRSRPGNIAPIGLLAIQLSTIERALMAMVRYSSALQSGTRMKLEHDDQHLVLNYLITEPNGAPLRHDAEFSLASTCGLIRTAFDLRWRPLEIGFCHPAPSSLAKAHLRTLFGAPVLFGQPVNRIIMPIAAARRTYRTDDPDMIAMTERHLVDLMQRTARATTVGEQVAVHVAMSLGSGELGIETIAAALQMSPRSLQRKLADEGTTLSRIVQKYRHERADALLVEGVMSIDEIATALGYADGTVFWRAYRGWTGFSPNQRKKSGEHSIAS
ncbi:AraC-like DNA-binding protein [Agrobacterium vitis]|nr:AraC-like DNA-binding protein [Agrobacterium vitis]MBE1436503.1 AraC-like DNA-binding protein [Agrobacterium vitis]